MARLTFQKALLTLAIIGVLASCSSDDDDPSGLSSTPVPVTDTGDLTASEGGATTEMDPEPSPVNLATTPVFVTTTCDAAPTPTATATSSTVTSPAQFLPDTLVTGRLSPDSTMNTEHYWAVDLQAGIYHLIVENRLPTGRISNIGLMVERTDVAGGILDRLIRSNQIDHRIRALSTVTLETAQTLRLKVTPVFGDEDYLMGVFANGTPVASPRFDNCPEISPLSIDTTEAFTLETIGDSGANEVWFQSAFEVADYRLSASATVISGVNTNIIFSADTYDQFGQIMREETVIRTNEVGTAFDASGEIQSADAAQRWIRFQNQQAPIDLSVTLTQN